MRETMPYCPVLKKGFKNKNTTKLLSKIPSITCVYSDESDTKKKLTNFHNLKNPLSVYRHGKFFFLKV